MNGSKSYKQKGSIRGLGGAPRQEDQQKGQDGLRQRAVAAREKTQKEEMSGWKESQACCYRAFLSLLGRCSTAHLVLKGNELAFVYGQPSTFT